MKNKSKIMLAGFVGLLSLTSCRIAEIMEITNINESLKTILTNNESVKRDFGDVDQLKYVFTGYKLSNLSDEYNLDVYGKLSNKENNSYVKLTYENVKVDDYNFEGEKKDIYHSICDIVSDYTYTMQNVFVDSFDSFDKALKCVVPAKDSSNHKLDSVETLNIDNLCYDLDTEQIKFNCSITADYQWSMTTIIWSGKVPIPITNYYHNYENYNYDISYNLSEDFYKENQNNTKKLLGVLEDYLNNKECEKYSVADFRSSVNMVNEKAKMEEEREM